MPCTCWYDPPEKDKAEFKKLCAAVVKFIKEENKIGDAQGIDVPSAQKLIDHLYTGKCDEKEKE